MGDDLIDDFIKTILFLLPDIGLTPDEIKARIDKHGYGGFIGEVGEPLSALVATAELLSMPGKGGR